MSRILFWILIGLGPALPARGQSCFKVVDARTHLPVRGALALCLGTVEVIPADSSGSVCMPSPCERIELRAKGFRTTTVPLLDALAIGTVELEDGTQELPPAIIEPWPKASDRQGLAAVTTADSTALMLGERSSLRSAVLGMPGVQWDERGHGGSARLSIRGSLQRSPFGVRGLKVYWGPFPLTLADGSTPLELIDPLIVGQVDVVRSIGAPTYGSAPSGLLLASAPWRGEAGSDVFVSGSGGPFGFYRLEARARTTTTKSRISAGILRQRNDGYRAQEWSGRDQAFIASSWSLAGSTTRVFLTWQEASWGLPGSLDSLTAMNDPRSARAYSQLIDAHVEKQQIMGGIATEMKVGGLFLVRTSVHGQGLNKTNPYGTSPALCGYKDETIRSLGARLSLAGEHTIGGASIAWDAGLEALIERDRSLENTFLNAVKGPLRVDGDTRVRNLNLFVNLMPRLGRSTVAHAGIGVERTAYDHVDGLMARKQNRTTDPRNTPMIGIERHLGDGLSVHARYATSVSRPTVWEILGTSGIFNASLKAERAEEFEGGVRWSDDSGRVVLAVTGYDRDVRDPIIAVETLDATVFQNQGAFRSSGIELSLLASSQDRSIWHVVVNGGLAAQTNLITLTNGARADAPGIPALRAALSADVVHRCGTLFRLSWQGSSFVWAATALDAQVAGYNVFHARVEPHFPMESSALTLFLQVENVLDARYTSWVQVNDPGGRYYNPAPGRSFFLGANLIFGRKGATIGD